MRKLLPVILTSVIAGFAITNCNYPKTDKPKAMRHAKVPVALSAEGKETCRQWTKMERLFNEAPSMKQKEELLRELLSLKHYWESSEILAPKFDSLFWAFLHDERTFYYPFKSVPGDWYAAMSEDGKVKMYSYNTCEGTASDGKTFLQYLDALGHLHLKVLTYPKSDEGILLNPVFKTIKKTKNGYILYGGTALSSQEYYETSRFVPSRSFKGGLKDNVQNDTFTVVYRQPVNGYRVKAIVRYDNSISLGVLSADLSFTKKGETFTLHTQCFGDTVFCKGRLDYYHENPKIFNHYKYKTVNADYHDYRGEEETMSQYSPFYFRDLDFDGIKELVIVHNSMAVRFHNGYDVYRIVEGQPRLIDYPPFNENQKEWGFGMTDYPEFDYKHKKILCVYPEGELSWIGHKIYAVSRKKKDVVTVNGRKHYYNHLELVKDQKY